MSNIDEERYSRQTILKGFGLVGQQKLNAAKVLVIGAGGLGCPALQYLAGAGVGTIGIADDDVVSLSNLHRQILYSVADIGLPKVTIAAAKLSILNPDIAIIPHHLKLKNINALNIIGQYDIILDGTDNFASRYMINDACVLLGKPLVYGAVMQYQGQVAIFNVPGLNGIAINYRHLFATAPKPREVPNCAEAGVLGVLPGIIGTMQAAEAIKLITGIGKPLINKLLTYNVLTNEMYTVSVNTSSPNKKESLISETIFLQMDYEDECGIKEKHIIEIDGDEFETLRKQPGTAVIDVREVYELPQVTNFEHQQIPMTVFKESIRSIADKNIILFCQHGIRSIYAGEMLQEVFGNSKQIYSLKGGISKWAAKLL